MSLTACVDLFAAFIEAGEFTVHDESARPWSEFDPEERWDSAQQARLANDLPHPRYGRHQIFEEDVRHWPEHWLAADGISPADRVPRGATTTIAELVDQARRGAPATGTIHADVTRCAGSAAGLRVRVDDGSDALEVWCPSAVCTHGPRMRERYEFDVVVRPTLEPGDADAWRKQREVQEHALAHDLERALAGAAELYAELFETPTAAEALAIRPLD